ncbi:MrcB family domain-containing protein [Sodalis sp. RH24]|uniref:MrcB family domain-containing protein n=1 Tax=unclassified Sodalis (in: enterobacteria) TaxID=2636512 RepID=UPI0039B51783
MELLNKVFENYFNDKIALKNKAKSKASENIKSVNSIIREIPDLFNNIINSLKRKDLLVHGSIGQGNMAEIPWISIFNKNITSSAQYGYYIVLLFSADMNKCFLSLNQAITAFTNLYANKDAYSKIQEVSRFAQNYIPSKSNLIIGEIDLSAKKHLGKGYELGSIASFQYTSTMDVSLEVFSDDLLYLLNCYDLLFDKFGSSLDSILVSSESRFQTEVLDIVNKRQQKKMKDSVIIDIASDINGVMIPDKKKVNGRMIFVRDPLVSSEAFFKSNFSCEANKNHLTFISKVTQKNFVEAHHLIPMKQQNEFLFSLDVVENIVTLCPNCHRLLHHASFLDKRHVISKLLEEKKEGLKNREILVEMDVLLNYYA